MVNRDEIIGNEIKRKTFVRDISLHDYTRDVFGGNLYGNAIQGLGLTNGADPVAITDYADERGLLPTDKLAGTITADKSGYYDLSAVIGVEETTNQKDFDIGLGFSIDGVFEQAIATAFIPSTKTLGIVLNCFVPGLWFDSGEVVALTIECANKNVTVNLLKTYFTLIRVETE